jgi:hypothetical protein
MKQFRNLRFGSAVQSEHRAMLTRQSCAIRCKPTRPSDSRHNKSFPATAHYLHSVRWYSCHYVLSLFTGRRTGETTFYIFSSFSSVVLLSYVLSFFTGRRTGETTFHIFSSFSSVVLLPYVLSLFTARRTGETTFYIFSSFSSVVLLSYVLSLFTERRTGETTF